MDISGWWVLKIWIIEWANWLVWKTCLPAWLMLQSRRNKGCNHPHPSNFGWFITKTFFLYYNLSPQIFRHFGIPVYMDISWNIWLVLSDLKLILNICSHRCVFLHEVRFWTTASMICCFVICGYPHLECRIVEPHS